MKETNIDFALSAAMVTVSVRSVASSFQLLARHAVMATVFPGNLRPCVTLSSSSPERNSVSSVKIPQTARRCDKEVFTKRDPSTSRPKLNRQNKFAEP